MGDGSTRLVFEEVLGRGGFGSVYRARMVRKDGLSRRVAVKVLNAEVAEIREAAMRTRDEARLLSRLNHDHIIGVLDLTELDGSPAVIMEYVEGVDLKEFVRAGRTPPRVALQIAGKVASALHAANFAENPDTGERLHLVHRDVKPGNVLVSMEGGVKLLDFGVAFGEIERESRTQVPQVGTLRYMAPEQFLGGSVGHAADMYALGMLLLELLLGRGVERFPIEESHFDLARRRVLAELAELELPAAWRVELVGLVDALLSLKPEDRPDGATFRDEALRLADEGPGPSLATHARRVVPAMLAQRRQSMSEHSLKPEVALDSRGFAGDLSPTTEEDFIHFDADPETSSRTMIPAPQDLQLLAESTSDRVGAAPAASAAEGTLPEGRSMGIGVVLGLLLAVVVGVLTVMFFGPRGGGEPAEVAEAEVPTRLQGVQGELVAQPSVEAAVEEAVAAEVASVEEAGAAEAGRAERRTAASSRSRTATATPSPGAAAPEGVAEGPDPSGTSAPPGATEPKEAEDAAGADGAQGASAAPEGAEEAAVADAAPEAGEASADGAEAAAAPPPPDPEPPTFAGLSGTWAGSAGGRPAAVKLQFDDSGGVVGVIQVQVGSSQTVVEVAGSYEASSDTAGTVSFKETSGRNPASYSGTVSGGRTISGRLSIGGKDRGELQLTRR